ncbi:MAG: hypothetical protein V2J11_11650, partial [Desulfofustis sp.]|nr:hypothetical protein [Desulfofustis sp.]
VQRVPLQQVPAVHGVLPGIGDYRQRAFVAAYSAAPRVTRVTSPCSAAITENISPVAKTTARSPA